MISPANDFAERADDGVLLSSATHFITGDKSCENSNTHNTTMFDIAVQEADQQRDFSRQVTGHAS
ncbi:MAG: hypothetical protein JSU75_10055 [Gammaproteobacteria bacterium]|nr:MAG: hypothetical protein JSU75_10055 [Gammaproteobacteria bacterium]